MEMQIFLLFSAIFCFCNSLHVPETKLTGEILEKKDSGEDQDPDLSLRAAATPGSWHFDAYRTNKYSSVGTFVPYDLLQLGQGSGLDLSTGLFTAQRGGLYHFTFTGMCDPSGATDCHVQLRRNAVPMATTYASKSAGWVPLTMSTLLWLNQGDAVGAYLVKGTLYDDQERYTHFLGYILQ